MEAAEEIGGDGDIKITLLWDFPEMSTQHVMQPNGRELCYRNMEDSRTGGKLDVDNREGDAGRQKIFLDASCQRALCGVGRYVLYRLGSAKRWPRQGGGKGQRLIPDP